MKVVCFDLDGTICDLWEGENNAGLLLIDRLSRESGHPLEKVGEIYDYEWAKIKARYFELVSDGLDEIEIREKHMIEVFNRLDLEATPFEYAELHRSETLSSIYIYPDAMNVIEDLGKKYRLTMVTNGSSKWQRAKIEQLGIKGYFDEIVVSGEVGYHKPNSRIFREMERRANVSPSDLVYIGNDYEKDIIGAKEAGWSAVWINRNDENKDANVSDYVVKELTQLLEIL